MLKTIQQLKEQLFLVFKLHWFKISIIALVVYTLASREFSLKVSIQAPTPSEQLEVSAKKETLTDNGLSAKPHNKFELLPQWGNNERANYLNYLNDVDESTILSFLDRFSKVANKEEEQFGIPARIILAHALLKSAAGTRSYASDQHNYFALATTDDWEGETQNSEYGQIRAYDNAWQSFRDHSLFLTTGDNRHLKNLDSKDIPAWTKALEDIFEDDAKLSQQLNAIIEHFGL